MRKLTRKLTRLALTLAAPIVLSQWALAQTYSVIHNFSGALDGVAPTAGLTIDPAGNFYGTTSSGGDLVDCPSGCGTVFKLTRRNSSWILTTLYAFKGGADGQFPRARVVFGPDGVLYGTTKGGSGNSCGTVFSLRAPARACTSVVCYWTQTVLYRFAEGSDGKIPGSGDLVFDQQENIYGTTVAGGSGEWGTVYKLTHAGGTGTESILYNFTGQQDGGNPLGGLVFDHSGNLFGTTVNGGEVDLDSIGYGVIFELMPSGSGWTESVLNTFFDDIQGAYPSAS